MKTWAVLAGVLCVAASPASADGSFKTGRQLYADCLPTSSATDKGVCVGYVMGVADSLARGDVPLVCVAEGVQGVQLADLVMKWLTENPDKRDFTAVSLIGAVLQSAFPCPARQ